jgi:hypothetical protein
MISLLSNVCPSVRPRIQSVALLGLMAVLAIGLAGPVQAQSSASAVPGAVLDEAETAKQGRWKPHFDEQIARTLRAPSSEQGRTSFLQTLIDVAVEEETMDFSAAVPALLHVCEHDSDPTRRLLALQALDLIAPEHTDEVRYRDVLARLYATVQDDPSPSVRRAVSSMLKAYQAGTPAS